VEVEAEALPPPLLPPSPLELLPPLLVDDCVPPLELELPAAPELLPPPELPTPPLELPELLPELDPGQEAAPLELLPLMQIEVGLQAGSQ
jgi:hypothetical protein